MQLKSSRGERRSLRCQINLSLRLRMIAGASLVECVRPTRVRSTTLEVRMMVPTYARSGTCTRATTPYAGISMRRWHGIWMGITTSSSRSFAKHRSSSKRIASALIWSRDRSWKMSRCVRLLSGRSWRRSMSSARLESRGRSGSLRWGVCPERIEWSKRRNLWRWGINTRNCTTYY